MTILQRFERGTKKTSACWNWIRSTDTNGYGRLWYNGHLVQAPKIGWMLAHGSLPSHHTLHTCDNRRCVNPSHLFLGSHKDNMRDMANKGRGAKPLAKLNEPLVQQIREELARGTPTKDLARLFIIDRSQIYRIKNGNTWKTAAQRKRAK